GDHAAALEHWRLLLAAHPGAFALVARDFASSADTAGDGAIALIELDLLYRRAPTLDLLAAIALLEPSLAAQHKRLAQHLANHPTLSAARALLNIRIAERGTSDEPEVKSIEAAITHAAKPLQRYRCAACGFEAQHYFWQCPGCLNWDTYPTQRLEDL
ncbi:MAG TPA: lipopolysaccharide assembly protein LapB, partial [Albitalea sp.]|nr:lipopolysaccharide assembly protein LapB [Albitalea sp.]